MPAKPPEMESYLQSLCTGTPRASFQAAQQLITFGKAVETPLVELLSQIKDPFKLHEILKVLCVIKISRSDSIERVLRLLNHAEDFVRAAAAQCLLQSSPKLRPHLGLIQSALKREKNSQIRAMLQKLLQRYPDQNS